MTIAIVRCTPEESLKYSFSHEEYIKLLSTRMRLFSFAMTKRQLLDGSKDVTRRLGWLFLKKGDRLKAVDKCMGFKKGEKPTIYGVIEVVSVRREPLDTITQDDVRREGFPDWTPQDFITFFCKSMKKPPWTLVTRVEFRRLGPMSDGQETKSPTTQVDLFDT